MNTKPVKMVMTCCDRIVDTIRAIKSLSKCHDAKLVDLDIYQEPSPGSHIVSQYLTHMSDKFNDVYFFQYDSIQGHSNNALNSLSMGFARHEYVVLLENDQLYAPDFVQMHVHMRNKYKDDSSVFAVCPGHYCCNNVDHDNDLNHRYTRHKWFHNQGWGTWLDRWPTIRDNWEQYHKYDVNYRGWDWRVNMIARKNKDVIVPFLSRVFNHGREGVHSAPVIWKSMVKLKSWAGDDDRISPDDTTIDYSFIDYNEQDSTKYFVPDGVLKDLETQLMFRSEIKNNVRANTRFKNDRNEISLNEEFGETIYEYVVRYNLRHNIDIGSWDGTGSTECFTSAMLKLDNKDISLQCVEANKNRHQQLMDNYIDMPFVSCSLGSLVSYDDWTYKNLQSVLNSGYNKIPHNHDIIKEWHDEACDIMTNTPTCRLSRDQYDAVLIDGNEFTGYDEFKLLKDRTKVFFLDDVHHAFKCYQVYHELLDDANWHLAREFPNLRNGGAVFIRVDLL